MEAPPLDSTVVKADALQGIACPNCGGVVPVPEGQRIVICPYCEQRSIVRGESGLGRFQVPLKVEPGAARNQLAQFLRSSQAIAPAAARKARLTETILVYVPFWFMRADVLGWIFGQEKQRRNKQTVYVNREVKIAEEMTWNQASTDVGEFGVSMVSLENRPLEPYNYENLHSHALVFEPGGARVDAERAANQDFAERVEAMEKLDRVSQRFIRLVDPRLSLVYYPLWVLRYTFRKRTFQVVVDGFDGGVLYGKAPGSSFYRAAMLVGGSALGAFLMIDVPALAVTIGFNMEGDDSFYFFGALALASFGLGLKTVRTGFQRFRYGEHYVFQAFEHVRRRVRRKREGGVLRAIEEALA